MKNLSFPKKMRLLNHKNFTFVFKKPLIKKTTNFTILTRNNNLKYPRIGLITTKKNIKKACNRNYIKRMIREQFRINQHKLLNIDFVILIKKIKINNHLSINFLIKKELQNLWHPYFH